MKLPEEAIRQLAEFVDEPDLRTVRIVAGRPWCWLPALFGMGAVTIAPFVIFRDGRFDPATPKGLALLAHEVGHIRQVREMGRVRFYAAYGWGQVRCGFRHDRHPLEIPCIELQRHVRQALRSRGGGGSW